MPKVTINDSQGLVQSSGSGLEINSAVTSNSAFNVASTLAVTGAATLSAALIGSVDTRTDEGAVSLTSITTRVVTNGAKAITLAAGEAGQIKVIVMTVDNGDATLTPAGGILGGSTTITFGDVGDAVVLVYTGSKWAVVSNVGCVLA